MTTTNVQRWRVSRGGRVFPWFMVGAWILFVPLAALANKSFSGTDAALAFLVGVVGGVIGAGAIWMLTVVPYVEVGDTLVIRNPGTRTEIPWGDVAGVRPGYSGVRVQRSDSSVVGAWAVQKANADKWSGKHTRADEVCMVIARRAAEAQGLQPEDLLGAPR